MMVANIANEQAINELSTQIVDAHNENPFEDGMTIMVDNQGYYALVEKPDGNEGREVMLTTFPKFLEVAQQSRELIRERRKVAKLSFSSISGILPQSENVFCLGAYSEGVILDSSLTSPSFEGGQIFILGLRSTNLDFAFNNEVIKDVGVPTTIFVVRTEKVIKASTTNALAENATQFLEVKAMFAACVLDNGRITEDTPMYFYPFSNTSTTNFGRVCLGTVFGSDTLLFENQICLDRLPYEFYTSMPSTHELAVNYASKRKVPYRSFLELLRNEKFPSERELVSMNMTYKQYINSAINSLYK